MKRTKGFLVQATTTLITLSVVFASSNLPIASNFAVIRWGCYGLFALFLIRVRSPRPFPLMVDLWALSFIILAFVSATYSVDPELTLERSFSIFLFYVAVALGGWKALSSKEELMKSMKVLYGIAVLVCIAGFFNFGRNFNDVRYQGLFSNPNALAIYALFHLPLALVFYHQKKSLRRIVGIIIIVASICLSQSRTSISGLVVCVVLFYYFQNRHLRLMIWLMAPFLVVSFFFMGSIIENLATLLPFMRSESLNEFGGRAEAWEAALAILRVNPFLGNGFGTEDIIFQYYDYLFKTHHGNYVHSSYLGLLMQTGIVGGLLFFIPLIYFSIKSFIAMPRMIQEAQNLFPLAFFCVLICGFWVSFSESWIYSAGNSFVFIFWFQVMILYRFRLDLDQRRRL